MQQATSSLPRTCCTAHKKHEKTEPGQFEEEIRWGIPNCCACGAKPIVATIERPTSTNSVAMDSTKEFWKTVEMNPCQRIAKS